MTFVQRLRRPSLTTRSALANLVIVAALGAWLSAAVHSTVEAEAVAEAQRSGEVAASFVQHTLPDAAYVKGLTRADRALLDEIARETPELRSLRIWGPGGEIRYDSDARLVGTRQEVGPLLAGAYAGRAGGHLETARSAESPDGTEDLLEVYVPLRAGPTGTVVGAVELYLPYDGSASRASAAAARMVGLLAIGLAALWGVLWWLALRVTHALRRSAEDQRDLAHTDELTRLPNRRALLTALDAAFDGGAPVALLLLDLDRFKEVNDTLGHHVGDRLLRLVSERLIETVGDRGTVARLGGDEFAVLLPGGDAAGAAAVADRLVAALERPFPLADLQVGVGTSIGVAAAPQDAGGPAELLQRADVAMYAAKARAGGTAVHDRAQYELSTDRLALLSELRTGLATGELRLVYQPTWDLQTSGACVAVEALVRWDSPTRGLVPPAEFVPLCERSTLVRDLTRFVLDESFRQCRAWEDAGTRLNIAVNLSARNLAETDLPDLVASLLEEHRLAADRVVLEVTESAFVPDPEGAAVTVRRLVELGVEIALDDFGTGWSSMTRLLELPIAALKVDRSFVADLPRGPGAAIVQASTALGHELGMFVVAEGIETAEQLARVVEIGCDVGQGFLMSRPLRPEEVPAVAHRRIQDWVAVPAQRAS